MSIEPRSRAARGISLVELLIFIVIVSVGVAGVLSVLNITAQRSADPLFPKQALAVAEAMLEEVALKDFDRNVAGRSEGCYVVDLSNAQTQANRSNFDCVADYAGFSTTGVFAIDSDGSTPISGLGGYNVAVSVAHPAAAPTGILSANDVWVITVTVTDPFGSSYALTAYRFNYG